MFDKAYLVIARLRLALREYIALFVYKVIESSRTRGWLPHE